MSPIPVLLVTSDDQLWQHWQRLSADRWLPARGRSLMDLARWREQGRALAVLDSLMPGLPSWRDPVWASKVTDLNFIVVSSAPNDEQATQVLSAGAHGYCHGYANLHALSQALEVVAGGGIWMGRTLVARLLKLVGERMQGSRQWQVNDLTEREAAVARCAAIGESNAEIARALGITERTVKARLSAAFEKMGVTDRLHLALAFHGIPQTGAPVSPTA